MKVITYRCNLCNTVTEEKNLLGVRWEGHPNQATLKASVRECETHICKGCIQGIQRKNYLDVDRECK